MLPSPALDSCVLFLLRHGATDNNLADPPLLQGCGVDLPLSAEGRWQAERTGELFAGIPLDAVIASPLVRARQTAEAVAERQGIRVEVIDALREVDVGCWEKRSWIEIADTEPDAHQRFLEDPTVHGYSGGENMRQVFDRVQPAMETLLRGHVGRRIVVVGHNVVNRVFLAGPLGIPLRLARTIHLDNCGISVLRYRDETLRLLTLNSALHLYVR